MKLIIIRWNSYYIPEGKIIFIQIFLTKSFNAKNDYRFVL